MRTDDLISKAAGLAAAAAAVAASLAAGFPQHGDFGTPGPNVVRAMIVREAAAPAVQKPVAEPEARDSASREIPEARPKDNSKDNPPRIQPEKRPEPEAVPPKPKADEKAIKQAPEPPKKAVEKTPAPKKQAVAKKPKAKTAPTRSAPKAAVRKADKKAPASPRRSAAAAAAPSPKKLASSATSASPAASSPAASSMSRGVQSAAQASSKAIGVSKSDRMAMARAVRAELARRMIYPKSAARRGIEGRVTVRFRIAGGRVASAFMVSGSGSRVLDENALKLSAAMAGFKAGEKGDLELEIPIDYRLE